MNQRGSILIESIVAISVAVVGILGVLTLLTRSLAITKDVSNRFIATNLASEGIEIVRNLVDMNIINGDAWDTDFGDEFYEFDYETTLSPNLNSKKINCGASCGPGTRSTTKLELNLDTLSYSYDGGSNKQITQFRRTIGVERLSIEGVDEARELKVISIVSWDNGEIILEDHFFDWRNI